MYEFLIKSVSRDYKIVRVNLIRITKSINLLWFCMVLGSVVIYHPLIEKSMVGPNFNSYI